MRSLGTPNYWTAWASELFHCYFIHLFLNVVPLEIRWQWHWILYVRNMKWFIVLIVVIFIVSYRAFFAPSERFTVRSGGTFCSIDIGECINKCWWGAWLRWACVCSEWWGCRVVVIACCTLSSSPSSKISPIIGLVMRQIVSGKRKTGEDLRGHGATRRGGGVCARVCVCLSAHTCVSVRQGCNYQVFARVRWIFRATAVVWKASPRPSRTSGQHLPWNFIHFLRLLMVVGVVASIRPVLRCSLVCFRGWEEEFILKRGELKLIKKTNKPGNKLN